MKPVNFVRQVSKTMRDSGGMFRAEVGVQEVSVTNGTRFRAYVSDGWGGGVQCFRDTAEDAEAELDRLWKKMFG